VRALPVSRSWYEDRFIPGDEKLTTTNRVFARDLGEEPPLPAEIATTKREAEYKTRVSPAPSPIKKPSMFSGGSVEERLETYRTPDALAFTMGKVNVNETNKIPTSDYMTTTQHFFVEKPLVSLAATTAARRFGASCSVQKCPPAVLI
jgi:hypothetical protein